MLDRLLARTEIFGDRIEKIINIIIIPLYLNLIVVVFLQVVCRYVLEIPFPAANELALYSFVWIVYLTAALAVRKKTHFNIELLENYLQGKSIEIAYKTLVNLLMLIVAAVLTTYGTRAAILGLDRLSPGSDLPLIYTIISIPICGVLMMIFLLADILKLYRK